MISNQRTIVKIVCSVLIFFVVATIPFEVAGSSLVQAAEPSIGQQARGRVAPEESLPSNITGNYTLTADNVKGAASDIGEGPSQMTPTSMVLEIPLEIKPVELEKTELAATGWQNIMSEGFEGTFPTGLWVTFDNDGATHGEYYWDEDDYKPHSGSQSAWCARGGADGLDPEFHHYANYMDSRMTYGPFSLADATGAVVDYWVWLDSEGKFDYFRRMASTDGTHFYGYPWTGHIDEWVADSFDLTAVPTLGNLCGQSQVWIAFSFDSDSSVSYDGAFIDDIVLRKYVAGAVPHIDSLNPNQGPVDARVVISGSGFGPTQGASTVTFGGVNADVSSWSDAQIVVWVPEGAGSNVVVHTTQGDSNAVSFTATDSPVDYWAVIVGVEDYPGTEDDLDYPNEDAWDVHDVLLAGSNWEEGHITMLLDSDATKANIHSAITEMGSNGDGNDFFFFYYSGHGDNAPDRPPIDETDGLDECLDQYDFATDPIWDDEFGQWLAALPSRKVAVSLDACYSGGQVKGSSGGVARYMAAVGVSARGDGFARDIDDIIGGVALTASAEDEVGYEDPALQNGVFTYFFVEGLGGPADSNADDQISMEEAFNYLDPLVSGYSVSESQNPQMYDGYPGELVILLSELNNPPNTPSGPSPTDHATGVSINSDLGWSGGDPDAGDTVTYEVYFGTSATPSPFSNDQLGSTYDPGMLNYNTKYYWYVAAMDNHGASVTGPLWDFTTQAAPNNPPNTPSGPSPTNHATGVSINSDLGWSGGDPDAGDTVTYDVYFGTSATPSPFSDDQPGSTCDVGTLNYSTKYYWYVAAMDNHAASVTGPIWDFTTQSESVEPTEVSISPPSQGVAGGDPFSVNVVIDPKVAIVGAQFSLSFDPSLLTANGVTQGNLLTQGGASAFFWPGTIDNGAGTITGVAGAIYGVGEPVSSPGTFVTISFTATAVGTSALVLSDVGVANAALEWVSVTVTDGSVTIGVWDDWDVNMDGSVNVLDMVLVGMHWGETGTAHWIRQDVHWDGAINVLDMIPIGQHWTG